MKLNIGNTEMKFFIALFLGLGVANGQFGVPPFSWGGGNRPPPGPPNGYGKPPGRPGPPGGGYSGRPEGGPPPGGYPPRGDGPAGNPYSDDPIPPHPESSYDPQRLPSKLPIEAPNGVVEIYNRVVDDLIVILKNDFKKRELDPMPVVIRATPPGPVRVPGYLQKRPFRRPGAALYRSSPITPGLDSLKLPAPSKLVPPKVKRTRRDASGESRFGENRPAVDGSTRAIGKASKGAVEDDEKEILETTPGSSTTTTAAPEPVSSTTAAAEAASADDNGDMNISISSEKSSEEDGFMKARSDEFFPDTEDEEPESRERKDIVSKKKSSDSEEDPEEEGRVEDEKEVANLMQMYHSQNSNKGKYKGGKKNKKDKEANKPVVVDPAASEEEEEADGEAEADAEAAPESEPEQPTKEKEKTKEVGSGEKALKSSIIQSEEAEDDEDDDDDAEGRDDQPEDEFSAEPGTGGGQRPNGGYYPSGGPPAVPAKPNAVLTGLTNIKRVTDVQVSVDARSAVITSRLLVGPIEVVINDSSEQMEKNVKARIPELEAELLLMERHGVVFLQRFTLDRAYGQDVEISVPKSKKEKKGSKHPGHPPIQDPNHPINVEARRQTKMAAHISMEVVKLLRSGNLRANLMRTATSAMSKLKLPIKKPKSKKGKGKKDKEKDTNSKKEKETKE